MPKGFSSAPTDLLRNKRFECNNNVTAIKNYITIKLIGAAPSFDDHGALVGNRG